MKVSVIASVQDILNHTLKTANTSSELDKDNKISQLLSHNTTRI